MATLKNLTINDTGYLQLPSGTTAERPASPSVGMLRYNTTTGLAETYSGSAWTTVGSALPSVVSVSPTYYNGEQGTSFTITGENFTAGSTVYFVSTTGTEYAAVTTFVNATTLTAITPQDFTVAQEPLGIKVVQSSGSALRLGLIDCGNTPAWTTAAGSLGTFSDSYRIINITVVATDADAGATLSYTIYSGSLPSGVTLSTAGVISGTAAAVATNTTYNFTIRVTDNAGNTNDRAFSITINAPIVTVYSYTGSNQTFTVPSGVTRVTFKLWGAGGSGSSAAGGSGGFTQATVATTASTVFTLLVGQGSYVRDGGTNFGGGAHGQYDGGNGGGDGGGRSAVLLSTTEILTAGGGGGGGYVNGLGGGQGGGLIGASVTSPGGSGGTQSAGGAGGSGTGGTATSGSKSTGGTSTGGWAGGGGGGGYYGGGGGAGTDNNHCGGGGGSGWVGRNGSTLLTGNEYGSVATPADSAGRTDTVMSVTYYSSICIRGNNSTDANFATGIGAGNGSGTAGGHGRIVVLY